MTMVFVLQLCRKYLRFDRWITTRFNQEHFPIGVFSQPIGHHRSRRASSHYNKVVLVDALLKRRLSIVTGPRIGRRNVTLAAENRLDQQRQHLVHMSIGRHPWAGERCLHRARILSIDHWDTARLTTSSPLGQTRYTGLWAQGS